MTIGMLTLIVLTSSLVLLKLALMAFMLFLMAKALFKAQPVRAQATLPPKVSAAEQTTG